MELTKKQQEALDICVKRYKQHEWYSIISGYAGTGKSTIVRVIIDALGVNKSEVAYAAFTGKAAQVLERKGNPNATTLHKLLYYSKQLPNGKYVYKPKRPLDYKVIVVDECSMMPKELFNTLKSHVSEGIYVIFVGDPGQLPPISDDAHILVQPHIFLDEIMRQAAESEIIQWSMKIRKGEPLKDFEGKEVKIYPKEALQNDDFRRELFQWGDQIICAKNNTRHKINQEMRELNGFSGLPEQGDKVICLHNSWDCIADNGEALVNGTIGYVRDPWKSQVTLPYGITDKDYIDTYNYTFEADNGADFGELITYQGNYLTGESNLDDEEKYRLNKKRKAGFPIPVIEEFEFGYAITCHRAQGSEWDKVVIIEQNFPVKKEEHIKWLYTAITRAAKQVIIIRR